jgi:hypothetical protein
LIIFFHSSRILIGHLSAAFAEYFAAFCNIESQLSHHFLSQSISQVNSFQITFPHWIHISTHKLLANHAVLLTPAALPCKYSNLLANFNRDSVVLAAHNVSVANAAARLPLLAIHVTAFVAHAHHSTTASASEATHTGSCSIALANASHEPYLAANAALHSSVQNN